MIDEILRILRECDSFAAIGYAARQSDVMAAVAALDELMRDLYWKKKDLAGAVALGRSAAQFALCAADRVEAENPEIAKELRGKGKAICYNLASFTWRGWGEEGICVTTASDATGLDAARANLRLARELNRGDLPMSRAWWMLGAQQISARDYAAAVASFDNAQRHATAAGERGEELLAIAFARLAEFLGDRTATARFQAVAAAIRELFHVKDGPFFAKQVVTALEVFHPECEGLEQLKLELKSLEPQA